MLEKLTKLMNKEISVAIIGLGYVGMSLTMAFSQKVKVIGYDNDRNKVCFLNENGKNTVSEKNIHYTTNLVEIQNCEVFIIAVPTPIADNYIPDLSILINVTRDVAKILSQGNIVIFESTVYPGVTEDLCIPILEKSSGMKCGDDFYVGYSPERINPGDDKHKINNTIKITSGINIITQKFVKQLYELVLGEVVYDVGEIKIAEATKVIENCQRDVNIAFMNEITQILNALSIDSSKVFKAMKTKWNALEFYPGLVGGHCIPVDSYYLLHKSKQLNYIPHLLEMARNINNGMVKYIVDELLKVFMQQRVEISKAKVGVLGCTYKANCADVRNSLVFQIITLLKQYNIEIVCVDPYIENTEKINFTLAKDVTGISEIDCVILAVAHKEFEDISIQTICKMYKTQYTTNKILFDIPGIIGTEKANTNGFYYWHL